MAKNGLKIDFNRFFVVVENEKMKKLLKIEILTDPRLFEREKNSDFT
jgi:hypothetical protein